MWLLNHTSEGKLGLRVLPMKGDAAQASWLHRLAVARTVDEGFYANPCLVFPDEPWLVHIGEPGLEVHTTCLPCCVPIVTGEDFAQALDWLIRHQGDQDVSQKQVDLVFYPSLPEDQWPGFCRLEAHPCRCNNPLKLLKEPATLRHKVIHVSFDWWLSGFDMDLGPVFSNSADLTSIFMDRVNRGTEIVQPVIMPFSMA